MLAALIILQVLDLLTTVIALRNPRLTEGSKAKVIQWLMAHMGVLPALLVIKGAFIGLIFWAAPQVPVELLYVIAAGYCWVVWNNIKLIREN